MKKPIVQVVFIQDPNIGPHVMPCCAFAAFILSQIIVGLAAIKNFVLNRPADSLESIPDNPATEWRLVRDTATMPSITATSGSTLRLPLGLSFRTIAIAASIEVLLVSGSAYGLLLHRHHHQAAADSKSAICHVVDKR
jgi:hypothetical protein